MSVGPPVQPDTRPSDEYAIAQRARNADARRGRLVRALMLTVSLLYVLALLIAPLAGIVYNALKAGIGAIGDTFSQPDVVHAVYLTFLIMSITVVVTGFFGVIVALVLARDRFRGKPFVSALALTNFCSIWSIFFDERVRFPVGLGQLGWRRTADVVGNRFLHTRADFAHLVLNLGGEARLAVLAVGCDEVFAEGDPLTSVADLDVGRLRFEMQAVGQFVGVRVRFHRF